MANVRTPHGQPSAPDGEEPEEQLEDLAEEQANAPVDELAGQMELPLEDEEQSTERVHLRLTPTQKAAYTEAAKVNGMKLSAWIRQHIAPAAMTKSVASAPMAAKNMDTIQRRIQRMHALILNAPDPDSALNRALMAEIVQLREPVRFLVTYFIEERTT